jgi:hypothetical protein
VVMTGLWRRCDWVVKERMSESLNGGSWCVTETVGDDLGDERIESVRSYMEDGTDMAIGNAEIILEDNAHEGLRVFWSGVLAVE